MIRRLKLHHPVGAKKTTSCEDPSTENGFVHKHEHDRRCPHCGANLLVEDCGEGRWEPRLGYQEN